jgi:hypothetical protein
MARPKPLLFAVFVIYVVLVACLAYSSTPKMEAVSFYEASANFYRSSQRRFPEDGTPYDHRCENLKPNLTFAFMSSSKKKLP